MKILAHGTSKTLICEISMDELARALGYNSLYSVSRESETFAAGREFDLGERVGYVKDLEGFPEQVRDMRKQMEQMDKKVKSMEAIAGSPIFQVAEHAKKTKQS